MYNVYGSQNEFVDSVRRVFILRMRSLGQNGPLWRDAVFAVARIEKHNLSLELNNKQKIPLLPQSANDLLDTEQKKKNLSGDECYGLET